MRALSQEMVELVDELHRATRARTVVALLARIAAAGEPLAAPRIMWLVVDDRPPVAAAAEQAVVALRRRVGLRALGACSTITPAFAALPRKPRWMPMSIPPRSTAARSPRAPAAASAHA